jgi:hypothetical protein
MTAADKYRKIAGYFKKATDGLPIAPEFDGAIKAMTSAAEAVSKIKCFNDTLWEITADCCNSKIIPCDDDERVESFLAGCTELERMEVTL